MFIKNIYNFAIKPYIVSSTPVVAMAAIVLVLCIPAYACGDETGSTCGNEEDDARYLLTQAVDAVNKNEEKALTWFTEQSHGFRTEDLYVYCIGPDHMMDAHPDPRLNHTDVTQTLIDKNGYHFGVVMLKEAKPGVISNITYLWPRLEDTKPSIKHTMFTQIKDQICAVGYYE